MRNHSCNFGRGNNEEHFCEIIFNLNQWFWRFLLKVFLSGALLFGRAEPFVQFW